MPAEKHDAGADKNPGDDEGNDALDNVRTAENGIRRECEHK
jgi:hypothetical protein